MKWTIALTSDEDKLDKSIPTFDYTKLTAICTCPRWGLVRYDKHKAMPHMGRATALEIGSAAHEGFAAIRFMELMEEKKDDERIGSYGNKMFGQERWSNLVSIWLAKEDLRDRVKKAALYAVDTSGFTDDPSDRRKTLTNLENAMLAYVDRLELGKRIPVVNDRIIGIEVPIDLTINFYSDKDELELEPTKIRYIGKVDAIVMNKGVSIEVEENKTASRLNDAWMDSFLTSHQVTGYTVAASLLCDTQVTEALIKGLMVPLPKSYDLGGVANVPVTRDEYRVREWIRWIWSTYSSLYLPYRDDPLQAPEFTHSCNRYFRPCSFIPLCGMASPEERMLTYSQMVTDEWNPLEEKTNG